MRAIFHMKDLIGVAFVAGLVVACPNTRALALDEPFEFDTGRWMSSKTYEDNIRRHGFEPKEEPAAEPEKKGEIVPPPTVVAAPKIDPAVAAFSPPVLPGLNKGFYLQVSSSEDEEGKKIHLSPSLTPGDVRLPEKKWLTPTAKDIFSKLGEDEDKETSPLKVRMTFLPAQNMIPTPSADHDSTVKKGHELLRKMAEENKQPEKTPEEAAACAALDAYKKQQLDAIQSDRQTLTALQNAIKSLGFSKQLDFITKKDSALNAPSDSSPLTASMSVETSVR